MEPSTPPHPIGQALTAARTAVAGVAGSPAWSLTPEQLTEDLVAVHELAALVAELELRLVAQADHDDLAGQAGAAATKTWWALLTNADIRVAAARVRLSLALDADRSLTRDAFARGELSEQHAAAIIDALSMLPADLDAELVTQVEKTLISQAGELGPRQLRKAGQHALTVIAPDIADDHLRRLLEAEEERARQHARFTMSRDGHGLTHIRMTLPDASADAVAKMVHAHWTPQMGNGPRAQGQALVEMIERYPIDRLPDAGGVAPTIVITMTLEQLLGDLGAAGIVPLDTGTDVSAGEARRLACEAKLIPAVLGRRGAVLDIGRSGRFHTRSQRIAMAIRDGGCTAEGCDHPPGHCQAHHNTPWSTGGSTSVDDGRLLCPPHHRMVHSGHYRITTNDRGKLLFHRIGLSTDP